MNLSKKETAAISKAYDTWLSSYISGDIETYDSYFDEAYHFIGSTNNEEYLSRKETTDFLRKTADQLAGKTELRNNKKTFEKQGSIVLITHFFDAYFLNGTEWTYYDRFRFSSAMHHTERGWLFIYQHFSTPDSNAEEGETIGYDQISAENKELREAINRRTVELENKTRDLEIQNSLERIRGIAMGMSKPDDLLEIAENIFTELKKHGFDSLRNTMINIYQDQLDSLLNYDFSPNSGKTLTTIQYKSHPLTENLIKETRSSKDVFSEFQVKGKKLQEWRDYRKGMGENDDPALDNTSILSYYFFSFAAGSIGISTYEPISSDKLEILKSFKNTFELTYKRYLDIQNALAQARESQIEAALERLRARSLSMQKSEELADASILLEEEIRKLGIENWGCAFHIYDEETTSGTPWDLEWFTSMAGILPFYKTPRENIFLRYYEESKKGNPLYIQEFGPEVIKEHYDYLKTLPVLGEALIELHNSGVPLPEKQIDHVAFFKHGHLLFITYKPVPEAHDIFIRFAKVFNQAYTRFLDLEKAEAQARESQIEVALERVRAKTMGMHSSDELLEIVDLLYAELSHLDVALARVVLLTINSETKAMHWWMASPEKEIKTHGFLVPPNNLPMTLSMIEAWENKKSTWSYHLKGKDKKDYDKFLFAKSELAQLPEEVKMAMSSAEQMHVSGYCNNFGLLTTSTLEPLSSTNSSLLERFGLVFQQTYTRFLDLQKAEAQAREAEIQLALERVRAKTMAMQSSNELTIAATEMFSQIKGLGLNPWSCGFNIFNDDKTVISQWVSTGDGRPIEPFDTPTTKGIFKRIVEDSEKEEILRIEKMEGKKLEDTYKYMASLPTLDKIFEELDSAGIALPKKQVDYAAYFKQGYLMFITYDEVPEFHSIFKRFAKVFEQTYTRFLDLQKAEAQAREAEIQLALERVRAKTMAMNTQSDLLGVIKLFGEQLNAVNIRFDNVTFIEGAITKHRDWDLWSYVSLEEGLAHKIHIPYIQTPYFNKTAKAVEEYEKTGQPIHVKTFTDKEKDEFLDHYWKHAPEMPKEVIDSVYSSPGSTIVDAFMEEITVSLVRWDLENYQEYELDVFERFAKEFKQTYIRFLDIKKAEAQAREAQIEAVLERIRGQVASMRESTELLEIMVSMRKEFVALGHEAHYFWHMQWLPDTYEKAMTSGDGTQVGMVMSLPRQIHGDIKLVADWEKGTDPILVLAMETETAVDYVHKMITWGDFEKVDPQAPTLDDIRHIGGLTFVMARTSHGEIGYSLPGSVPNPPQKSMDTLVRFAKVFDLAYKRFEDLKKAEHQTRETQIELALERVRSRSMAMQKSEELKEVIQVVYDQFVSLDIHVEHTGFILDYKDREDMFIWLADKNGVPSQITLPYFDCPHWNSFLETKKNGGNFFANLHTFEEKNRFYEDLFKLIPDAAEGLREIYLSYSGLAISTVLLNNIGLYIENFESKPYSPQENAILMRFGKVFQQTYTRFLDLKRAEAQAKEAQIESSLERVRAQTMAMHNSQDIGKCIVMMFEELTALGVNDKTRFGIGILNHENENNQLWTASKIDGEFKLHIGHLEMSWHPLLKSARKAWKEQIPLHTYILEGEDLLNYYKMLNQAPDYKIEIPLEKLPEKEFHYGFVFEHGFFYAFCPTEFPADIIQIIHRFSSLFSQTYRRYLDLKRAEAQAREAQINLGVERVRAKALAMHNSSQILEVVDDLKNEMLGLEISGVVAATIYLKEEEDLIRMWDLTSVQDTADGFQVTLDLKFKLSETHPKFFVRRIWNNTAQYFVEKQDPKDMAITIDWLKQYNAEEADNVAEFLATNTFEYLLHPTVKLANGKMSVDILNTSPPAEMESIMVKMGAAFDLAYKRFQDLQKAEAQVREAKIEAALEKIRSRTMAMQQSDELPEAANVLFNEVRKLGIPAWSCGYNILSEDLKSTTCWMSSENEIQTPFRLPLTEHESMLPWHQAILDQQEFFVYEQGGKDLVEHYRYLGELPELKPVFEQFDAAGISLPTFQVNHLGRFTHGFLLFITYERVPEAHDIFMRFTKVFDQTYTRFLDLQQKEEQGKKLIEEKLRLEKALKDLQATQAQLIQSEKMASLGELTAGIAHEIQNPLNFVNNFSEVSEELVDEMNEELENGDIEEAIAIGKDLKDNLSKINLHGKRADSIVKGMLEHSRINKGVKAPTDLNSLTDEFVRLSFHGLRAKDKSFNSDFKIELDPNLPKANVVASDIGRVILNLVNNAFYAVDEKAKTGIEGYKPEVVVISKKTENGIEISVQDNGSGIPDSIKEKIFQPFFTTKPTGSGTGLGLSLSYDIVKAHGGELRVESEEGKGTIFIIQFTN